MAGGRKHRVLIADESITIQKLVHIGLAGGDFEVIAASDGPDALQKVKTIKPALVLIDASLRRVSGLEVVESIRSDTNLLTTKVVLLAGKLSRDEEAKAKKSPADEVLAKPFDAKTLLDLVQRLLFEEESTVVPDEENETPIVKISSDSKAEGSSKIERINRRLKDAVASVAARDDVEDTVKVKPADFKRPVHSPTADADAQSSPPAAPELLIESIVRAEVRRWLETHFAAMAEKLLKEEISKLAKR